MDREALIAKLLEIRSDPKPDFDRDSWSCIIGEHPRTWVDGGDGPMRDAVREAYKNLTGEWPKFLFSGWGRTLDEGKRACVESREPDFDKTTFGALTQAADALASDAKLLEELKGLCDDVDPRGIGLAGLGALPATNHE